MDTNTKLKCSQFGALAIATEFRLEAGEWLFTKTDEETARRVGRPLEHPVLIGPHVRVLHTGTGLS